LDALDLWPRGYRAYAYLEGSRLAANVSVFPLPLMIAGRRVEAGGVQSVATAPPYRGQGLFSDLMERMLQDVKGRYATLLLYSGSPALYHKFGFRTLRAQSFAADPAPQGGNLPHRRLSLESSDDIALVRRLFRVRTPVSDRLGLIGHEAAFFLNVLWHRAWDLLYLPDHDALLVRREKDGVPQLLDVVAARMPPLAVLAGALGRSGQRLEIFFPPDKLKGRFESQPLHQEDEIVLMARGPFAVESLPFLLPPTADF
jgi:GNAT superfamily N-acetyltransferase